MKKRVEELQARKVPSIPHEVLEERSKATFEAVTKVCDGEKLYTKIVEVISTIWEALLEDEAREKIKADAQ